MVTHRMAKAARRSLLFFLYWIAPSLVLLLIIFGGSFQIVGYLAFGALLLFHAMRGRDFRGNPVAFGIRRDSSLLGEQRGTTGASSLKAGDRQESRSGDSA